MNVLDFPRPDLTLSIQMAALLRGERTHLHLEAPRLSDRPAMNVVERLCIHRLRKPDRTGLLALLLF